MSVVNSISAAEAIDHSRHGEAVMVDARPQVMRHQGSLPGAVVVEPGDVPARFTPTPSGTFLLRCSLCAEHSDEQVEQIIAMFEAAGKATGAIN